MENCVKLKKCVSSKLNQTVDSGKVLKTLGYTVGKTIGVGTYSKVCLAYAVIDGKTHKVACKRIHKDFAGEDFIQKFLPREIRILQTISHPNIIKVHDIFEIKNCIYIFMDYCSHGDMLEYIRRHGPLSDEKTKYFFKQLVSAVEYLHDLDIAHRDLKCENILLISKKQIKLGDFGFARYCTSKQTGNSVMSKTFCGSAAYAAPEILQGIPYDPKMYDIWALGCILYVMLTASMPFDDADVKKMIRCQLNCDVLLLSFTLWKNSSPHLRGLLGNLLEPKVEKRATIKDVVQSTWLQGDLPTPKSADRSSVNKTP